MLLLSLISLSQHPTVSVINVDYPVSQIPFKDFHIDITALDGSAELKYNLNYWNGNGTLIKTNVVFPFDTDMVISDITMKYKDKVLVSAAMKKPEAKETCEKEIERKHTSLLVSRENDKLSIQLSYIPPETMVHISFTVYAPLPVLYDTKKEAFFSKFIYPHRLIPLHQYHTSRIKAMQALSNSCNFSIKFNAPNAASLVYNDATDEKDTIKNGNSIQIYKVPSKDFCVSIYYQKEPSTQIEHLGSSRIVNFKINPLDIPSTKNNNDVSMVFLVDSSQSMFGKSIVYAREALNLFIHSIGTNVKFDIVRFGTFYDQMFGELKEFNEETLEKADAYIKQINSNFGDTEILNPLRMILTERKPDIVFLLTNGDVENINDILQLAKDFKTRIHTLGIGDDVDVNLVRGLAQNSGGTYELIDHSSQIEGAVIRSLNNAISPALSNVKIESDCGIPLQRFPDILPKGSISTFSFIDNVEKNTKCSLKISGTIGDNITYEKILSSDSARPSISSKHLHVTSIMCAIDDDVINESFALKLSQEYNLMTKVTSLILVDSTTEHKSIQPGSFQLNWFVPKRRRDRFVRNSFNNDQEDNKILMESGREEKKEKIDDFVFCKETGWSFGININEKFAEQNTADSQTAVALFIALIERKCGKQSHPSVIKGREWLEGKIGAEKAARLIREVSKKLDI